MSIKSIIRQIVDYFYAEIIILGTAKFDDYSPLIYYENSFLKNANTNDLKRIIQRYPWKGDSFEKLTDRLSKGCECLILYHKGIPVAFSWYYITDTIRLPYIWNIKIRFTDKIVYIFDVFTDPSYRRSGFNRYIQLVICHKFPAKICIAAVRYNNHPSIKMYEKAGYLTIGKIKRIRIRKNNCFILCQGEIFSKSILLFGLDSLNFIDVSKLNNKFFSINVSP